MLELAIFDLVGTVVVTNDSVSRVIERLARGELEPNTRELERALLMHYASPGACAAVRGVTALFDALRLRGAKVALVTPLPAVVVDSVLDRLGWLADGLVDLRVAGDELPRSQHRRREALLREAMRRELQPDARAVAAIGDSPAFLEAAATLGCAWSIGATWGASPRAGLVRAPHTALVEDPSELRLALLAGDRPSSTRPIARFRRTGDVDR